MAASSMVDSANLVMFFHRIVVRVPGGDIRFHIEGEVDGAAMVLLWVEFHMVWCRFTFLCTLPWMLNENHQISSC